MNNSKKKEIKHLINDEIKSKFVLLIKDDNTSEQLETSSALQLAKDEKKDLILISQKGDVPVVKIVDYGKFVYEWKRKNKNTNKNVSKVKSITVKPKIDTHDLQWKANKAIDWLKDGDQVLFIVRAFGRMSENTILINNVFDRFSELVANFGNPKSPLKKINKVQYESHFFPIKK